MFFLFVQTFFSSLLDKALPIIPHHVKHLPKALGAELVNGQKMLNPSMLLEKFLKSEDREKKF